MARHPAGLASALSAYDALWVGGLALLLVSLAVLWPGLDGEQTELFAYLLLGTAFPLCALVLALAARGPEGARPWVSCTRIALAGLLIVAALWIGLPRLGPALLLGGVLQAALFYPPRSALESMRFAGAAAWARVLTGIVIVILVWSVVGELLYWGELDELVAADWLVGAGYLACVLLAALALRRQPAREPSRRSAQLLAGALACAIFAAFALNTQPLLYAKAFGHWGCFTGPAQLVRQGGWLLWDVPAQYGFLSTLAIAYFPAASTWQSLYLLNAALLLGSACILYAVLRASGTGVLHYLFCVLVSVSAVFLMPGHADGPTGVQLFPSVGAFRFFWCYALLGFLAWSVGRSPELKPQRVAWFGSLFWLLGSLWSSESFVYCTAIWIPASVVLRLRARGAARGLGLAGLGSSGLFAVLARALALPAVLLFVAATVICGWYLARLGHLPDPLAFFDSALAFGLGYWALPLPQNAGVLLLALWLLTSAAVQGLRASRPGLGDLALISAAWGAVWATSSYAIGHSHESSTTNLAPLYCCAVGVMLIALRSVQAREPATKLLRVCLAPLYAMVLFAPIATGPGIARYFERYVGRIVGGEAHFSDVDVLLPVEQPSVRRLLQRAGVAAEDRINSLAHHLLGGLPFPGAGGGSAMRTEHPAFLPLQPAWILDPMDEREERVRTYFQRFIARSRMSGWLLIPNENPVLPWLEEFLLATHRPARTVENLYGRLVWMELLEREAGQEAPPTRR